MLYWTPESSFVYNNLEEVIIPFDGNKLTFSTFANGEVKEAKGSYHSLRSFGKLRDNRLFCCIFSYKAFVFNFSNFFNFSISKK